MILFPALLRNIEICKKEAEEFILNHYTSQGHAAQLA